MQATCRQTLSIATNQIADSAQRAAKITLHVLPIAAVRAQQGIAPPASGIRRILPGCGLLTISCPIM
jgi:hypothetical protein